MTLKLLAGTAATAAFTGCLAPTWLGSPGLGHSGGGQGGPPGAHGSGYSFVRLATFPVYRNNTDPAEETVAEIIDATPDGKTLVYTDAEQDAVGFVDIANPSDPQPGGTVGVDGEPTAVSVTGGYALIGVSTSPAFVEPSGHLAVLDLETRTLIATIDLAGQPDSVKASPDGRYAAIAIENERDEAVVVDGVEGGLPQAPAGLLQIVDLQPGNPDGWAVRDVDLTGLAEYAPDDPEPEFVDVNKDNQAVVTLQENNHIAIVDLKRGRVKSHFPAGTADLVDVDTVEDDVIDLSGSLDDVPREPDGVTWMPGGRVATADEGDLFGGSRGFTIFAAGEGAGTPGQVVYESGSSLEHLAVRHGHYPENRSENKGAEPEGVEHARYGRDGRDDLLFVGSERGGFVAVYELPRGKSKGRGHGKGSGKPQFVQLLPTGIGPEGLLPLPERDLFVATSETDDPQFGVRTVISIFGRRRGPAQYPEILSADAAGGSGQPIPWSGLSGMAADPQRPNTLHMVWDSLYAESKILTVDVARTPAVIRSATPITGGSGDYDPEGIDFAPDGTTWIASEGNASGSRPNRLLQLDASGAVIGEVGLPDEILACRAATANRGSLGSGFEGVAVEPAAGSTGGYKVHVVQQRGWDYTTPECEHLDDDPDDSDPSEPAWTRVWSYDPASGGWDHIPYELEPLPANAAWVGLSEITRLEDDTYVFIERDNRTGDWAELKWLTRADLSSANGEVTRASKSVHDMLPAMRSTNGWISDKLEGFAVAGNGRAYAVTDNDGVDGWSGETQFLRLGRARTLFG